MLDKFLVSETDGHLYDTTKEGWHKREPLRRNFCWHPLKIENTTQLRASLRAGEFTPIGGYRLAFVTSDGGTLSFDAVRANLYQCIYSLRHNISDGWKVCGLIDCDNTDAPIYCDHTGQQLNETEQEAE